MPLILKSDPSEIHNGVFTSSLAWVYQHCTPQRNEEVFIWTAETAGGVGLAMRGNFLGWSEQRLPNRYPGAGVRIFIAALHPREPLTIDHLRPFSRKTKRSQFGPQTTLSDKVLDEARNKIARLERNEPDFLAGYFDRSEGNNPQDFPKEALVFGGIWEGSAIPLQSGKRKPTHLGL
jgi:hypothetical protein